MKLKNKMAAKKIRTKDESATGVDTSSSYVSTALEESKYKNTHTEITIQYHSRKNFLVSENNFYIEQFLID
jgi:hypothetical protein